MVKAKKIKDVEFDKKIRLLCKREDISHIDLIKHLLCAIGVYSMHYHLLHGWDTDKIVDEVTKAYSPDSREDFKEYLVTASVVLEQIFLDPIFEP